MITMIKFSDDSKRLFIGSNQLYYIEMADVNQI